jgi:hypothetical protein
VRLDGPEDLRHGNDHRRRLRQGGSAGCCLLRGEVVESNDNAVAVALQGSERLVVDRSLWQYATKGLEQGNPGESELGGSFAGVPPRGEGLAVASARQITTD